MNIKILSVIITTAVVTGVVFLAASKYLEGRRTNLALQASEEKSGRVTKPETSNREEAEQIPKPAEKADPEEVPAPKSIYLLYPTGNEVWQPGGAYEIRWQPQSVSGAFHIYAFYRDMVNSPSIDGPAGFSSYPGRIASVDVTRGGFTWNIPTQFTTGIYKIRISNDPYEADAPLGDAPREVIAAESGLIAIKNLSVKPPVLMMSYPMGGEVLTQGKDLQVRWQGGGEKVSIALYHKGLYDRVGASVSRSWSVDGLNNSGSYTFTIPDYLSGNFFFEISDNTWQTARSSPFSILAKPRVSVSPKIEVVTPVTDQKLRRGDLQLIQWISVNVSKVTVEVLRQTGGGQVTQSFGEFISDASMPWTPGLLSWAIPKNFEEGNYIVRVTDWQHGIRAESGVFTIAGDAF